MRRLEEARTIVRLFEENPDAGTIGHEGRMLDRPHWARARGLLAMAERAAETRGA